MKNTLITLFESALDALVKHQILPQDIATKIVLERTRDAAFGEFATNVAMTLAKAAKIKPTQLAQHIIDHMPANLLIAQLQIAGPGFINIFLKPEAQYLILSQILTQGVQFGCTQTGQGRQVQIEFVSANPTGPLHVGHGRGAAIGDALSRLLTATGWQVTREFYYNDAGVQIHNLALSVKARLDGITPEHTHWPEAGYRGHYIADIASSFLAKTQIIADDRTVTASGDINDMHNIRDFAVAYLRREQDLDLKAFAVSFDVYYLESSLYQDGRVQKTVDRLISQQHTFEQDGALWLKTTDFGDDKDRVMRKSDGTYTYFLPDVAYHFGKWERGFVRVINEQGADHHGTIARVRAGLQALDLGIPKNWPDYVLHQMVMVLKNGEEVKISKRAGDYVTLRDLIDEVGCDATRFFLVARKPDSHLQFDIDLATAQSNDNPVYYIQYAHARICSVLREIDEKNLCSQAESADLSRLNNEHEMALITQLSRYPEQVEAAATNNAPHMIAIYLQDLAAALHAYYNAHKFLIDDLPLRQARLTLIAATRQVLSNGLSLLGVSAPERM